MTTMIVISNPAVPTIIQCPVGDLPQAQSLGAGEWGIDPSGNAYFDTTGATVGQLALIALDPNLVLVSSNDPSAPLLLKLAAPSDRVAAAAARERRAAGVPRLVDGARFELAREARDAASHPKVDVDVSEWDAARAQRHQALNETMTVDRSAAVRAREARDAVTPPDRSERIRELKDAQAARSIGRVASEVLAPARIDRLQVSKPGSVPEIPVSPRPVDRVRDAQAQAERAAARQRTPIIGQPDKEGR